jgi:penicillin-binding protein-related factor A (putative recombinase)
MLESALVTKVLIYLRNRGGFWAKIHGGPFQTSGLPDIIGCYRGFFIAFEAKRAGEKPKVTSLQLYTLNQIKAAGGRTTVIQSVEEVVSFLDGVDANLAGD